MEQEQGLICNYSCGGLWRQRWIGGLCGATTEVTVGGVRLERPLHTGRRFRCILHRSFVLYVLPTL